jgi:hypothetical protein
LPNNLTEIGTEVFKNSTVKKINIPSGIADKVNSRTFAAYNLEDVEYSGELTSNIYSSVPQKAWKSTNFGGAEFVIFDNTLMAYNGSDKNVVIPEGVKEISKGVFKSAQIDTVSFPTTLETIGQNAFYASTIKEVVIPSNVRIVSELSFAQCPQLTRVVIEDGVKQINGTAFAYCENLYDVTVGTGTFVARNAFDDTPYKDGKTAPTQTDDSSKTGEPEAKPQLAIISENGSIGVTVGERAVVFTDVKPFIDEYDRTQIPVRAVSEMLGCGVSWDGESRTVTVTNGDDVIKLVIGSDVMYLNGAEVQMDTSAVIKNDRTYIPVRYVGEALGCEVEYIN